MKLSLTASSDENKQGCYLTTALGAFISIIIIKSILPWVIPFELFQFWKINASIWEVLSASWVIFVWGAGLTLLGCVLTRNNPRYNRDAETYFALGTLESLVAGIFEEISFRWLIFFSEIPGYLLLNFLFFGFLGFGIPEWFYTTIEAPFVDFLTLGKVHDILFGPWFWAVGAAMISSNGKFQDGHAYLGFLGSVNSWFMGMFFFYLMFQYGLIAGVIVHFLYDFLIFVVMYIDAVCERSLGWSY